MKKPKRKIRDEAAFGLSVGISFAICLAAILFLLYNPIAAMIVFYGSGIFLIPVFLISEPIYDYIMKGWG